MERMTTDELIALFRAGAAVGSVNWQIADRIAALTEERDALRDDALDWRAQVGELSDRIAALALQLNAALDRDIAGLRAASEMARAMNDLLQSPTGVVPDSAARFYDAKTGRFYGLSVNDLRGATEGAGG
jgi:hypothetical protein